MEGVLDLQAVSTDITGRATDKGLHTQRQLVVCVNGYNCAGGLEEWQGSRIVGGTQAALA